jgi:hypothetical protein
VAALAGQKTWSRSFNAGQLLDDFSRDVWPLQVHAYVPCERARTVDVDWPDELLVMTDGADLSLTNADQVWFVSGLPVSPTSRRKAAARYAENVSLLACNIPETHPAYALATHLNSQAQTSLGKLIRSNWPRLESMWRDMPDGERKRAAGYTLRVLDDYARNIYAPSERTVRIHAIGTTIHQLPREMRKAALSGAIEMDMRSSQLAIVAKLWGLPILTEFLASRLSIWPELLGSMGVGEQAKSHVKAALYACCYGMGQRNVRVLLGDGVMPGGARVHDGLGAEATRAFMRHPLIQELLRARNVQMRRIADQGGIIDAFGQFWPMEGNTQHGLLSVEAQAVELSLMLPIYEVARQYDCLVIVSCYMMVW